MVLLLLVGVAELAQLKDSICRMANARSECERKQTQVVMDAVKTGLVVLWFDEGGKGRKRRRVKVRVRG